MGKYNPYLDFVLWVRSYFRAEALVPALSHLCLGGLSQLLLKSDLSSVVFDLNICEVVVLFVLFLFESHN